MNIVVENCIGWLEPGHSLLVSFYCFPSIIRAEQTGVIPIPAGHERAFCAHAVGVIGYMFTTYCKSRANEIFQYYLAKFDVTQPTIGKRVNEIANFVLTQYWNKYSDFV
jgi:hypothetical protein